MIWSDYVWPGSDVLRNRLSLRDAVELDYHERELVSQRLAKGAPSGKFDQRHLQAIHRHLFQDVYDWAGQLRRVDMNKGGLSFLPYDGSEMGLADVHRRLEAMDRLRGRAAADFAVGAGEIIGDLNHAHRQLAAQAGHRFDARRLDPRRWIAASIQSQQTADPTLMIGQIASALRPFG